MNLLFVTNTTVNNLIPLEPHEFVNLYFQPAWWPSQVEWGEALLQVRIISTPQSMEVTWCKKFFKV